jgi:aminoglycoside/choline kinase family phosphotransferase
MKALDFFRAEVDPQEIPQEWILERLRNWRNAELAKSDWTQIADAVCDKAAWATYRQTLRDLPASNADAHKIEMPIAP